MRSSPAHQVRTFSDGFPDVNLACAHRHRCWELGATRARDPLDICPRWLAYPCEAVVNLRSKQHSPIAKEVVHTIKCFGTSKVCCFDVSQHMHAGFYKTLLPDHPAFSSTACALWLPTVARNAYDLATFDCFLHFARQPPCTSMT